MLNILLQHSIAILLLRLIPRLIIIHVIVAGNAVHFRNKIKEVRYLMIKIK